MQWFEYIIIIVAVLLVVGPIILKIKGSKKDGCTHSCANCKQDCPLKKYMTDKK